jgi:hypothetical protein
MSEIGYNTNLASEFYVLSMLHRLGANANLTLGNKKSVDIAVVRDAGEAITVDVKGLAGTTSWPVDNVRAPSGKHFIVFVCYGGKIADPTHTPEAWVIPSSDVARFIYHAPGGRRVITRSKLRAEAQTYKDLWASIV